MVALVLSIIISSFVVSGGNDKEFTYLSKVAKLLNPL